MIVKIRVFPFTTGVLLLSLSLTSAQQVPPVESGKEVGVHCSCDPITVIRAPGFDCKAHCEATRNRPSSGIEENGSAKIKALGLRIKEPPPPNFTPLPPEANVSLGRLAVSLATKTTALGADLKYKMLKARPTDLIYTVEAISASWKEYNDPTTLDNLVKAIQVDAITELYKTVSTSGLRPVSHLGELLHAAETMKSGSDTFERVEQFFNLLDKAIDEALGLRPKPRSKLYPLFKDGAYAAPIGQGSWVADASYQPQDPLSDERVIRERLLYVTLSSYLDAGMYDQLLEFYQLAAKRWGRVTDAGLENRINELVSNARRVTTLRTLQFSEGEGEHAPLEHAPLKIEWGHFVVINFKVNNLNAERRFSFSFDLWGKKRPEDESERLIWVAVGSSEPGAPTADSGWFDETSGWFALDQTRLPSGLTAAQALGRWNALKIEYRKTQRALFFYLNGRLMGSRWSPIVSLKGGPGILTSFQITIDGNTNQSITFRVSGS